VTVCDLKGFGRHGPVGREGDCQRRGAIGAYRRATAIRQVPGEHGGDVFSRGLRRPSELQTDEMNRLPRHALGENGQTNRQDESRPARGGAELDDATEFSYAR